MIVLAVPVLGRPHRVAPMLEQFDDPQVRLVFLPDPDDEPTMQAIADNGADYLIAPKAEQFGRRTYASKINYAFANTDEPFVMYGGDDIRPSPGWAGRALQALRANPQAGVLAANERGVSLVRMGKLATHGIVRRSYVEQHGSASLPESGPVMHEGYWHWCCDCEVSYVARMRNAFLYDERVVVEHRRGRMDATYKLGQSGRERDRALLAQRCPGWPEIKPPKG